MIARITGVLEQIEDGEALIALAGGVAHQVLVPAYLARRMAEQPAGAAIMLHTIEYFESQNQGASFIPRLIGFASPTERSFFELLTSVKGLGNKRALRAMASEPGLIARAIHDRDTRALQRLPEIGPKLAELIVHELKGKVEIYARAGLGGAAEATVSAPAQSTPEVEAKPTRKPRVRLGEAPAPASSPVPPAAPPIRQTVEVLITLGETPLDAERLVARAIERARAGGATPPMTTQELVTAAYAAR